MLGELVRRRPLLYQPGALFESRELEREDVIGRLFELLGPPTQQNFFQR